MDDRTPAQIVDLPELRDRVGILPDREAAGEILAEMLAEWRDSGALVVAIPAGGVPVAAALARWLGLDLEAAPTSKILLPWTAEAGYGAVAWDGTVVLNHEMLIRAGLSEEEVGRGIAETREKVAGRVARLRPGRAPLAVRERTVILVDDGLASGYTMVAAAQALRAAGAAKIIVAVPTGHPEAIGRVAPLADGLYCANVRRSGRFAVAEAYQQWHDVSEEEALGTLKGFWGEERVG